VYRKRGVTLEIFCTQATRVSGSDRVKRNGQARVLGVLPLLARGVRMEDYVGNGGVDE
jgi:hypothetical protein